MEICKTCNGKKHYEIFVHSESGKKIKGHIKLNEFVYQKTNEYMKYYEDEYRNLKVKPELTNKDSEVQNNSFNYVLKKWMTSPDFAKVQKEEAREFYKFNSEIKECEDCGQPYKQYMQNSKGQVVHLQLLQDLMKTGTISKDFEKLVARDLDGFCLSGKPRNGKTLFLKYTWNRILNEIQEPNKFFWISEMALFQEFRDEKTFKGFMNLLKNYDYIFIDELFAVENWKDSNADRDKATITHRNNFTFWDTLTNDSSKKVFCTTNQVFGLFKPNTASERIIERIKEICEIMEID